MTIVSATPASSTPWTTLSAKRPSVDFRLTAPRIQSPDAAIRKPAALAVLVSLRPLEHRGARGRLRHPRTRARPRARRDPGGPVRAEPPQPAAAAEAARPAGVD